MSHCHITPHRGFTLIELVVAVGLFALIMTLAAGSYLMMIGLNRQAQGLAAGINSLSFVLDTMTRDIRIGYDYCGADLTKSCTATAFSFKNKNGIETQYALSGDTFKIVDMNGTVLTDYPTVTITGLTFTYSGIAPYNSGSDVFQPTVRIVVKGIVTYGAGKTQSFIVESAATMRGADI